MVTKTKAMNESAFAKVVKELNSVGELIRARQGEKQSIINDFDKEKKRYRSGKISEKTLASSVQKTDKELKRLDDQIRKAIKRSGEIAMKAKKAAANEKPKPMRVRLSGITVRPKKKKAPAKKKSSRRKK